MIQSRRTGALFLASALALPSLGADDLLIADFEGADYGEWRTTGDAFGPAPARGTLPGQMRVDGYLDKGLVNSFHGGDTSTGTLTSPPFRIERRFIRFLVGGGMDLERTCMNLIVDGQIVRAATGPNDRPGGSEHLGAGSWDVEEFTGQMAVIQIVDQATGGWGHINVDHIVQTDRKPPGLLINPTREFQIQSRYLNLPIRNGAPKRTVTLFVDGHPVVQNQVELADGDPDWWAPMDLGAWRGRSATIQVDRIPEDSSALSRIEPGDRIKDGENLYREPGRAQFHFSPKRGWNNDPNGLVFYKGEFHLFFQHNPYGWNWGNMHWGHAVSRDLVHWQELGEALLPDPMGPMFSGSAVVDWKNTSGLGRGGHPPLVLLYTAAGRPTVQCLAFSLDGRRFEKFDGNPVLEQITAGNRDPKVIWHEPTRKWVMALYVEVDNVHTIQFFGSSNLREWSFLSRTDDFYECPDFFELAVDDDPARKTWVLTAANGDYQLGLFDGNRFAPQTPKLKGHLGRGFYAAQTFSDIPPADGRRIQIGWFQTPTPGMPFNQSMTVPLELKLVSTPEGPRMRFDPVRELAVLRTNTHRLDGLRMTPGGANPLADVRAELVELLADFEPGDANEVIFTVRGATIAYSAAKQALTVNGLLAPAPIRDGRQRLTIFCDRQGLEVFAGGGLTYVPMPFIPPADNLGLAVETRGGPSTFRELRVHELKSIWDQR